MNQPPENRATGPANDRATCSHREVSDRGRRPSGARVVECLRCGATLILPARETRPHG